MVKSEGRINIISLFFSQAIYTRACTQHVLKLTQVSMETVVTIHVYWN